MSDAKHISKSELLNYLRGTLKDKEAHHIERLSQQDTLLMDALEGLENLPFEQVEKHLEEIEKRLNAAQKRKAYPLWKLVGIAASLFLIVTTGYFIWRGNEGIKPDDKLAIRQNETDHKEMAGENEPQKYLEDNSVSEPPGRVEDTPGEREASKPGNLSFSETRQDTGHSAVVLPEGKQKGEESDYISMADPVQTEEVQVNLDIEIAENAVTEEVALVDSARGEYLAARQSSISENSQQTLSFKQEEDFTRQLEESRIEAKPYSSPQQQQVVVSVSSEQGNHSNKKGGSEAASDLPVANSEPLPVNGYESLNEYLLKSRKIETPDTDYAFIEFQVKENSKLSNFHVLDETREGLGKEAVRLIKEGPNWFPAIENGVAVTKEVQLRIEF